MLPAVSYTLADFLSTGLPSVNTDSIRFEHPSFASSGSPSVNLYLCDISRSSHRGHRMGQPTSGGFPLAWFNVSFLLTVQENTQLGRQRIISAAMTHCQRHPYLSNHQLLPTLQGYGRLPLQAQPLSKESWRRLNLPQQPGLSLTLTVPFEAIRATLPIMA